MKLKLQGLSELVNEQVELASLPEVQVPQVVETVPKSYHEIGEEVYLDLERAVVYGFQEYANHYKVNSIIEGIHAGDTFPPVFVYQNEDGSYDLVRVQDPIDNNNYGGHHRAVGHLKAKSKLRCIKVKKKTFGFQEARICIADIPVHKRKVERRDFLEIKKLDQRYK